MTDEKDQRTKALGVMTKLFGDGVEGDDMPARDFAPEFFDLASTACFGGFWSREALDLKSRSLATVSQLAALGRTDELKLHLQGARNLGWTPEELTEVLMQTSQYAGIPAAVQALNVAASLFGEEVER